MSITDGEEGDTCFLRPINDADKHLELSKQSFYLGGAYTYIAMAAAVSCAPKILYCILRASIAEPKIRTGRLQIADSD